MSHNRLTVRRPNTAGAAVVTTCGGMFSNFAPQRPKAGWGRRSGARPVGAAVDRKTPPVMFSNFAPQRPKAGWGRRPQDPTGFMPVVNQFGNIASAGAAVRKTPPVLCRW